jgi:hypothetical protein
MVIPALLANVRMSMSFTATPSFPGRTNRQSYYQYSPVNQGMPRSCEIFGTPPFVLNRYPINLISGIARHNEGGKDCDPPRAAVDAV